MIKFYDFNIKVLQEDNWTYYAEVINLPWCFTNGDTIEELNVNLREAISSYLWSMLKDIKDYKFQITNNDIMHA
jgi:predicted RNase H-like HicB family nuclease